MSVDTLALIEGPAQLLHLLEWCHGDDAAERTQVAVLAPPERASVGQLRSMAALAAEEGLAVQWFFPRNSLQLRWSTLRQLRAAVAGARRLVIGDPFSGLVQALLLGSRPREVVIVDDGTATMEFASQLLAGEPLQRWDVRATPSALARMPVAAHARSVLAASRLQLFTVMPVPGLPASQVRQHHYDWTRRRFGLPRVLRGVDVIGSSLVESGVVGEDAYVAAVAALADRIGGGRYFAHRREDAGKLTRIAKQSGLAIARPRVPLEIELRRGSVASVLATFPSSVGYTLPRVLAGLPVRLELQPVPAAMLVEDASARAKAFLERMSADLRTMAGQVLAGGSEFSPSM